MRDLPDIDVRSACLEGAVPPPVWGGSARVCHQLRSLTLWGWQARETGYGTVLADPFCGQASRGRVMDRKLETNSRA
jgi:hypothetical protein